MNENDNFTDLNPAIEQQLHTYYSIYSSDPAFKANLQKQLAVQPSQQSTLQAGRRENKIFEYFHYRPAYKWVAALVVILLIFIMLIVIRPVRAAIERLIDFGYLDGAGFVRVSETYVLPSPVYSMRPEQTIAVERVIADPQKTMVWLRVIGKLFAPEEMNSATFATMEINRQSLPSFSSLVSYTEDERLEEGVYKFSYLGLGVPSQFVLHLPPDWNIPIRLIPMGAMDNSQTKTIYPDLCQTHLEVELCLRAFVSDKTGYHLWLSASSRNPLFYIQILDIHNPLTGESAILTDSSGHQLDPVYSSEPAIVMQVSPVITDTPEEVKTYLSFERTTDESGYLVLLVGGLTGQTPVDELIMCEPGSHPGIGDQFPCEKTINIAGELIKFHTGEITQKKNYGTILTLQSDPIQSSNGLLLTGVDYENINNFSSSSSGMSFDVRTKQLELWCTVDPANPETLYGIRIIGANLTILEPFQLTWKPNP